VQPQRSSPQALDTQLVCHENVAVKIYLRRNGNSADIGDELEMATPLGSDSGI
jgi:hypothetical protein